jgi:cell shape-determining protein MreD
MREKCFFALFGFVAATVWVMGLAVHPQLPQWLLLVCGLGCLRLSKGAVVGGACLAGLIWDAFDWQVRLGTHAVVLGIGCFLLSGLRSKLEINQPAAWPVMSALLGLWSAIGTILVGHLLGVHDTMPQGWWSAHLIEHPVWLAALAVALSPWRTLCRSSQPQQDAPVSLIPLFLE